MEPALFYKIIDELRKLKWKGEICPQFYGEPLLDDRLSCLLKYVKDALPQSKIVIFTNGDFLTVDLYKELIKAGVKEFHITQHSEEVPVNMKEVLDYRKEHGDDSIPLSYYKLKEFFNRGGLIEIENVEKVKNCKLRVSGDEIGVNYAGDIIFCCNDYLGTVKMGNISNEKLIDIWRKPYYRMLRKELRKNIFRLDVCKKCKKGTRLK